MFCRENQIENINDPELPPLLIIPINTNIFILLGFINAYRIKIYSLFIGYMN